MTSNSPNYAQCFGCKPFWIQKDHGISVLILLVATTLEICERIC
jgi:hypothetical protein